MVLVLVTAGNSAQPPGWVLGGLCALGGGCRLSVIAPSLAKVQSDPKPQLWARDRRGACMSPWETLVTQGASALSSFLAAGSGHCSEKPSPVPRVCGKARGETEAWHCGVAQRWVWTPSFRAMSLDHLGTHGHVSLLSPPLGFDHPGCHHRSLEPGSSTESS